MYAGERMPEQSLCNLKLQPKKRFAQFWAVTGDETVFFTHLRVVDPDGPALAGDWARLMFSDCGGGLSVSAGEGLSLEPQPRPGILGSFGPRRTHRKSGLGRHAGLRVSPGLSVVGFKFALCRRRFNARHF